MLTSPVIVEEADCVVAVCKATGMTVDDWYKGAKKGLEVSDNAIMINHKKGSFLCESIGDGNMRVSQVIKGHKVRA